jgi:hypothetical protein
MNARTALVVSMLLAALPAANATEPVPPSDITVTGKEVTAKDLEGSNPVATLSKEEIRAVTTTGKPACKNGSMTTRFDAPSSFSFADQAVPIDEFVKRVRKVKDAGKISCLHVIAAGYDKAVYAQLSHELVDGMGVSLFWDETEPKR